MWYVIWTLTGGERKAKEEISKLINKDLYNDVFYPEIVKQYRIKGEWIDRKVPMFPGYLFVETDTIEEFDKQINKISGFHKVLEHDKQYYPISNTDYELIHLAYKNKGVFDVSRGVIEGGKTKIITGPLKGLEGIVTKIDRHNRTATIEVNMFNSKTTVKVGLEIISKT